MPIPVLAITALISSILAARQQAQAAGQNAALGSYGLQQNASQNAAQRVLQERALKAQLAPSRDAVGNVTRYIPGRGWEVVPTALSRNAELAGTQSILDQLTRQRLNAIGEEGPARRRRLAAGTSAQALLPLLTGRPNDDAVQGAISRERLAERPNLQPVQQTLARQINRTGAPGGATFLDKLARVGASIANKAGVLGPTLAARENADRQAGLTGVVKTLLQASQGRPVPAGAAPNAASQALQTRQATAPQAFGVAAGLRPQPAGIPQVQANLSLPLAINSIGSAISGYLDSRKRDALYRQLLEQNTARGTP